MMPVIADDWHKSEKKIEKNLCRALKIFTNSGINLPDPILSAYQ